MADLDATGVERLEKYARDHEGQVVTRTGSDKGDCWALPFEALKAVGAATPCQTCGDKALYVWGRKVELKDVQKGDIMQVDGGEITMPTDSGTISFSHHSAIILDHKGTILTAIQQWPGAPVFIANMDTAKKTGAGTMTFYRPQQP